MSSERERKVSDEREKFFLLLLNSKFEYRITKMKTSKRCSQNVGFEYHFYSVWTWIQNQSSVAKQKNLWWDPRNFGFEYRKPNLSIETKHSLNFQKCPNCSYSPSDSFVKKPHVTHSKNTQR